MRIFPQNRSHTSLGIFASFFFRTFCSNRATGKMALAANKNTAETRGCETGIPFFSLAFSMQIKWEIWTLSDACHVQHSILHSFRFAELPQFPFVGLNMNVAHSATVISSVFIFTMHFAQYLLAIHSNVDTYYEMDFIFEDKYRMIMMTILCRLGSAAR